MAIRRLTGSGLTTGGKSSKLWDQETSVSYMDAIATAVVDSGGASSITFSNIPKNYTHLQIRGISRDGFNGLQNALVLQFNSDTGANYAFHYLQGNGTAATATGGTSNTAAIPGYEAGSTAGASMFGATIIDVLDYTNQNKYKTLRSLSGVDNNGSGAIRFHSSLWMNTGPITTIKLYADSSASFVQYSHFSLYGLRG